MTPTCFRRVVINAKHLFVRCSLGQKEVLGTDKGVSGQDKRLPGLTMNEKLAVNISVDLAKKTGENL